MIRSVCSAAVALVALICVSAHAMIPLHIRTEVDASVERARIVSVRAGATRGSVSVFASSVIVSESGRTLYIGPTATALTMQFDGARWLARDRSSGRVLATSSGRQIQIEGSGLRADLKPIPFALRMIGRARDRADLATLLPLEDYIAGVLVAELPKDWPLEVFKAQAVAARSFALAKFEGEASRKQADRKGWMFEGTTADQAYDDRATHDRAQQAVRETRGEVLIDDSGLAVAAHYHSDCGGQTDEPKVVWGAGPRLGVARDRNCPLNPRGRWRLVRSLTGIQSALQSKRILPNEFRLASLSVGVRAASGRAIQIFLMDAISGRSTVIPGERLREALGFADLRSTLFNVKASRSAPGEIEFSGRGFGHGSGLCQWGARQLALSGKLYHEILEHYYPNVQLGGHAAR